jgi:hypothetical protein
LPFPFSSSTGETVAGHALDVLLHAGLTACRMAGVMQARQPLADASHRREEGPDSIEQGDG